MEETIIHNSFAEDIKTGLSASPKYLLARYFYDERGSEIFVDIMNMPEYYVTDCEKEIFENQSNEIAEAIGKELDHFDLIELGSGDGVKTMLLLKALIRQGFNFTYKPVDISTSAMEGFVAELRAQLPGLAVEPVVGDYFHLFDSLGSEVNTPKAIMFLGANIGNFNVEQVNRFLDGINQITREADKLFIGFDMIKSPEVIYQAYKDPHGHTAAFNLNLLERINRELGGNFIVNNFEHHTSYNPQTGSVESFLVSTKDQTVLISEINKEFHFTKWEPIFMELSQKYNPQMIHKMAADNGFAVMQEFTDSKEYFTNSLWIKDDLSTPNK